MMPQCYIAIALGLMALALAVYPYLYRYWELHSRTARRHRCLEMLKTPLIHHDRWQHTDTGSQS